MTSCAEIPEKIGINDGRVVAAPKKIAQENQPGRVTMRQTNERRALFHRRVKPKNSSKASAHLRRRLSSPIRFNSKLSLRWNMKTCWSRRRQAAARRGLRERKSGGLSIAGDA